MRIIAGLSADNPSSSETLRFLDHNGDTQWEQWHGRVLLDDSKTLLGYQAIGKNITHIQKTQNRLDERERQLAHLGRVTALGEMVAGISHELNQPLAAIGNYAVASRTVLEKQSERVEDNQNIRRWIERIQNQTDRINEIIQGLRRFAKPGTATTRFSMKTAITVALELCESRTRTTVDQLFVQCPDNIPDVYADRVQIEQVLVNLVRNACDAMSAANAEIRQLSIEVCTRNEQVLVAIEDSGPGISPDRMEVVFESFVTTKSDGMGIGLAISRSIIESHGGQIYALPTGKGARLEFVLPIAT